MKKVMILVVLMVSLIFANNIHAAESCDVRSFGVIDGVVTVGLKNCTSNEPLSSENCTFVYGPFGNGNVVVGTTDVEIKTEAITTAIKANKKVWVECIYNTIPIELKSIAVLN